MTVQDSINVWGRAKLAEDGRDIPEGSPILLTEDLPGAAFCHTCGPGAISITIQSGDALTTRFMSMGEVIQEILVAEVGAQ